MRQEERFLAFSKDYDEMNPGGVAKYRSGDYSIQGQEI